MCVMNKLERLREEVRTAIAALPGEPVALAAAAGRALTRAVDAVRGSPPFSCSAMDGYAVRAADVTGAVRLAVSRTRYAGELPGAPLAPGSAARIFTGAPLPPAPTQSCEWRWRAKPTARSSCARRPGRARTCDRGAKT